MKNLYKFLLIPGMALALTACTDLSEDLKGDITTDISNPPINTGGGGGAGDILEGAFAELRNSGTANHSSYYSVQEITSDEMCIAAKGGDWFDGGILVQLHRHTYTPTHDFVKNAWNGAYNAIGTCNELLNGELEDNQRAQTRVLRAFFYWRLMDLFGNVKIVTVPNEDAPQSNRAEVFDFVESEILDAIGISEVSDGMDVSGSILEETTSQYRINTHAALGILAKVYLNAEVYTGEAMYDKAAIAASYVIDNGPYFLCGEGCTVDNLGKRPSVDSDPDKLEGYAAVFAPNNEGNPENIFTINYDEVTGGGMNFSQMNLHYSSQFTWNFDAQPWNGYATLEEFYNSYEDGDLRKANNFEVGLQTDYSGATILDFASDDGDLPLVYTPEINELEPNSLREAGARPSKFSFKQFGRPDMNNDFPVVRLGELYLIRAEGLARAAGDWSLALDDVNVLRERAGVADFTSMDAETFLAERGREMFQEAIRRTDMIRFGAYTGSWWEKDASEEYLQLFPIPQEQIVAADGTLTQNPGY